MTSARCEKIIECKLTHWSEKCIWALCFLPAVACMTMQDELCRTEFNLWLLIACQSCLTIVFAARQVIFVFPISTVNISYQKHWHTSVQGMPWSCMCIVLLHTKWCSHVKPAPTALEVQEAGPSSERTTHLRCLVSIHGHWGAGYLAWPPGLSASHSSCNCSLTWNELHHNGMVFLNEVFSEAQRRPLPPPPPRPEKVLVLPQPVILCMPIRDFKVATLLGRCALMADKSRYHILWAVPV